MTTPTTNYGWIKPDPTEPADIRVINTLMDAMDTSIKSVRDTLGSKVYRTAQYRIIRKITISGGAVVSKLTSTVTTNALWEREWYDAGNIGGWDFQPWGDLSFSSYGIYKISYQLSITGYTSGTTSGTVSVGLYKKSDDSLARRTKTYHRMNTMDGFARNTIQGSFYLDVSPTTDQVLVSTDYYIGVQQHTTAGTINIIFNPTDLEPFRSQFTLECVRDL